MAHIDLLKETSHLVGIFSESFQEEEIADYLETCLQSIDSLSVKRIGNALVASTNFGRSQRLVLAGHIDTVPESGNLKPIIEGNTLFGLGSADMKAGLAVMLGLGREVQKPALDVTYVFYPCEEVDHIHNGLFILSKTNPELLKGDAAILLEPTSAAIEAGCQGVIRMAIELRGKRAHSARPWMGVNAIHRSQRVIEAIENFEERKPVIDDCQYHEVLQAVGISGGVAMNVIPDEVVIKINHRSAPDRTSAESIEYLQSFFQDVIDPDLGDVIEILDISEPAPPGLNHPLLSKLKDLSGTTPRAKLGWTDVSFFASLGIPALNYGPGDAALAHGPNEKVDRIEIENVYETILKLLENGL